MSTVALEQVARWFGNVVAVNDITMTIGPGVTGLLGPNGAGKSTLINMMGGFLAPSTGTVTLDGQPTWRNEAIYKHIGIVPERIASAATHSAPAEGAPRCVSTRGTDTPTRPAPAPSAARRAGSGPGGCA